MPKAKMKVVQCWDDGVLTDIRLTELLRKYNAKATFNLNPGGMNSDHRTESKWITDGTWSYNGFRCGKLSQKDIADIYDGFELASHCWKHENADSMPVDQWIKTAVDARNFLEDIVQKPCTGFAWPCGVHTPETRQALREHGFTYGRTVDDVTFVTDCDDVMAMPVNVHFLRWQFFERYEKAKECGVFYFWGHSYELMNYEELWQHFEERLKFINDDPDSEWANINDIIPLCKNSADIL